jgi:hypothetical protein
MAVIAVAPAVNGVATPFDVLVHGAAEPVVHTVATNGLLEVQVAGAMAVADPAGVYDWFVRLTVAPDEVVPMAMKLTLAFLPVASEVCAAGKTASETIGSPEPDAETVTAAVAVTRLPSVLVPMAVTAAAPAPTAVTNPPAEVMVAIELLLDAHVTDLVMFRVKGAVVYVPIAISWLCCPAWMLCVPGRIVIDCNGSGEAPPPFETVKVAVPFADVPSAFV